MAKDDYPVIVYQILSYLYQCIKLGETPRVDYLRHDGKLFQINKKYWTFILINLKKDGLIRNIIIDEVLREEIIEGLENIQITSKGIEYLTENSFIQKARSFLKEIKDIAPFV